MTTTKTKSGCSGWLTHFFGTTTKSQQHIESVTPQTEETLPYRLRDDFLSPAELNFYRVLKQVVGDSAIICLKVSLNDLFYPKTGNRSDNHIYRNKIDRKHVDFLLCDAKSVRPIVGIELDDASHQRISRVKRDHFVEQVFTAAELPLLRQPVRAAYNTQQLIAELNNLAGLNLPPHAPPDTALEAAPVQSRPTQEGTIGRFEQTAPVISFADGEVPLCPKCKQAMVLRTVQKIGPHHGKQFWGCRDFPKCRGVREFK